MKSVFESFLIALSMYSTIPVKCPNWNPKNLRYALVFFPSVGLIYSLGIWLAWLACTALSLSGVIYAVLCILALVFITGGIHIDGFCDTADALYSRREREEKLRILKDPNCGPFAIFSVITVFIVHFGGFYEIYSCGKIENIGLLAGGFVISRCLSALSLTKFPIAPTSSLAKIFGENACRSVSVILMCEIAATAFVLIYFFGVKAVILTAVSAAAFTYYYFMQKKQFGGVTGDLAGFFLVICESLWILAAAICGNNL